MADFNSAVMTEAGVALLAASIAGNAKIKFTKLVTGSGEYTEVEKDRGNLQGLISLKEQKQEFPFSSITMATNTCVKLISVVTNEDVTSGYYVNEVGIYAIDELNPDNEPILYSIAVANVADYLPPYNGLSPSTITQEYYATVDNALEVTIQTGMGAYALAEDLIALQQELYDLADLDYIETAFFNTFTKVSSDSDDVEDATDETAMSEAEVEAAIATVWDGESSDDETAMSAEDVQGAIDKEWNGETSTDETALSAEDVENATK